MLRSAEPSVSLEKGGLLLTHKMGLNGGPHTNPGATSSSSSTTTTTATTTTTTTTTTATTTTTTTNTTTLTMQDLSERPYRAFSKRACQNSLWQWIPRLCAHHFWPLPTKVGFARHRSRKPNPHPPEEIDISLRSSNGVNWGPKKSFNSKESSEALPRIFLNNSDLLSQTEGFL